ncbi:hypothetical protein [Methylomicrobium lacus]|uniref:hypothetical protein n=1 Tax=Methylomicrobium lacus TaxID=136992 RepID=UPI0019D6B7D8|nr:hypothetical protein [Methylomicrobium lacus]
MSEKKHKKLTIEITGDAHTLANTYIKIEKPATARSTAWRGSHIAAIRERCFGLGIEEEKIKYLQQTYGVNSLTMLSDADIEEIYKWIMQHR